MFLGKGSGNSTTIPGPGISALKNNFPAPPVAPNSGSSLFAGFANSPMGQRFSGKPDPVAEIYGGSKPRLFDALKQQAAWANTRENAMTPAQKRQRDMLAMMSQQGQQPAQLSQPQFNGPSGQSSLTEFVQNLLLHPHLQA